MSEPTTSEAQAAWAAQWTKRSAVFDGLADHYERFRPDYPEPIVRSWLAHLDQGRTAGGPRRVADVGCGTGISTRALARAMDAGDLLAGVEPGSDMRARFRAHPRSAGLRLVAGGAERLPFGAATLHGLVSAQAAHWFDRPAYFAEARRVLKPGGTVAILNNNQRWDRSDFLDAYQRIYEALSPNYTRQYRTFDYRGELEAARFADAIAPTHDWERTLDAEGFLGLAQSSSMFKNAVKAHGRERIIGELTRLTHRFADARGTVVVPYETELIAGRVA